MGHLSVRCPPPLHVLFSVFFLCGCHRRRHMHLLERVGTHTACFVAERFVFAVPPTRSVSYPENPRVHKLSWLQRDTGYVARVQAPLCTADLRNTSRAPLSKITNSSVHAYATSTPLRSLAGICTQLCYCMAIFRHFAFWLSEGSIFRLLNKGTEHSVHTRHAPPTEPPPRTTLKCRQPGEQRPTAVHSTPNTNVRTRYPRTKTGKGIEGKLRSCADGAGRGGRQTDTYAPHASIFLSSRSP